MTIKQAILTAVCLGSFSAVGVLAGDNHTTGAAQSTDAEFSTGTGIQDPAVEDENLQAETRGEVRTNADLNNDGIVDENEVTVEMPASFERDNSDEAWDGEDDYEYDSDLNPDSNSNEVSP